MRMVLYLVNKVISYQLYLDLTHSLLFHDLSWVMHSFFWTLSKSIFFSFRTVLGYGGYVYFLAK